jgi:Cys-tRNA(Pro)/Cys-tRNA(Cys) deacylase
MSKPNALRILQKLEIDFDVVDYQYDASRSSIDWIASQKDIPIDSIYKTLICKGNKTGLIVALVAGNRSLSLKKLAVLSCNRKVSLVKLDKLQSLTGYLRGGCSPLGLKRTAPVFVGPDILNLDRVYVNAGRRGVLFSCTPEALITVCKASISEIYQVT